MSFFSSSPLKKMDRFDFASSSGTWGRSNHISRPQAMVGMPSIMKSHCHDASPCFPSMCTPTEWAMMPETAPPMGVVAYT